MLNVGHAVHKINLWNPTNVALQPTFGEDYLFEKHCFKQLLKHQVTIKVVKAFSTSCSLLKCVFTKEIEINICVFINSLTYGALRILISDRTDNFTRRNIFQKITWSFLCLVYYDLYDTVLLWQRFVFHDGWQGSDKD